MLPIAAILTAAALTGILVTVPMLVCADETETSTDQSVKQKNTGSTTTNTAKKCIRIISKRVTIVEVWKWVWVGIWLRLRNESQSQ
jgi:hypothetical protein